MEDHPGDPPFWGQFLFWGCGYQSPPHTAHDSHHQIYLIRFTFGIYNKKHDFVANVVFRGSGTMKIESGTLLSSNLHSEI